MSERQQLADKLMEPIIDHKKTEYRDFDDKLISYNTSENTRHRSLAEIVKYVDWYFNEINSQKDADNLDEYMEGLL